MSAMAANQRPYPASFALVFSFAACSVRLRGKGKTSFAWFTARQCLERDFGNSAKNKRDLARTFPSWNSENTAFSSQRRVFFARLQRKILP